MPRITITIEDVPAGAAVTTDGERPQIGRLQTPAQALAMDLLRICSKQAIAVSYGPEENQLVAFARSIVHPEGFGHAVPREVIAAARRALGTAA